MFLSRSGLELNNLWTAAANLIEIDTSIGQLHRVVIANPGDVEAASRYAAALRRAGRHDEADQHTVAPHAHAFADASNLANQIHNALDVHMRNSDSFDPNHMREEVRLAKEFDDAHEAMESARDRLDRAAEESLTARGHQGGLHRAVSATARRRLIKAHGASFLPRHEDWHDEHPALLNYHNGRPWQGMSYGRSPGGLFDSDADKHSYIHSLVSRNPRLRIHWASPGPENSDHYVSIHGRFRRRSGEAQDRFEPSLSERVGSVRTGFERTEDLSTVTPENYIASFPPHRHPDPSPTDTR